MHVHFQRSLISISGKCKFRLGIESGDLKKSPSGVQGGAPVGEAPEA